MRYNHLLDQIPKAFVFVRICSRFVGTMKNFRQTQQGDEMVNPLCMLVQHQVEKSSSGAKGRFAPKEVQRCDHSRSLFGFDEVC